MILCWWRWQVVQPIARVYVRACQIWQTDSTIPCDSTIMILFFCSSFKTSNPRGGQWKERKENHNIHHCDFLLFLVVKVARRPTQDTLRTQTDASPVRYGPRPWWIMVPPTPLASLSSLADRFATIIHHRRGPYPTPGNHIVIQNLGCCLFGRFRLPIFTCDRICPFGEIHVFRVFFVRSFSESYIYMRPESR
jgi:hypothetical protein